MKIPILTRAQVQQSFLAVSANLELYRSSDFAESWFEGGVQEIRDTKIDCDALAGLSVPAPGQGAGLTDAMNAHTVFHALEGMTPYLAQDERVWVAITHLFTPEFVWERWVGEKIEDDKNISAKICSHYFARVDGKQKGIERNNALSSLWWWAHLIYRCDFDDHVSALTTLLSNTDFREQLIGRPTTAVHIRPFKTIVKLKQKWEAEKPDSDFFSTRKDGKGYREWFKRINRLGGLRLLATYEEERLRETLEQLITEVEAG
jgi:hypothetical protein